MKTKLPHRQAIAIANSVISALAGGCARIEVAGSLRRESSMVGDIEIVAVPLPILDLFGEPQEKTQVDLRLDILGIPRFKDGAKYKQFVLQGTQVDLFLQPDPSTWGVNFLLRTGSAEFAKRMVTRQEWGGLMPNEYSVHDARVWRGPVVLETPEEEDVFRLWDMDWIEPKERVK